MDLILGIILWAVLIGGTYALCTERVGLAFLRFQFAVEDKIAAMEEERR